MQNEHIDYSLPTEVWAKKLPPLITVKQAEATGAASGRTLRRMCANGELRAAKLGNDWRIARDPFLRRFALTD